MRSASRTGLKDVLSFPNPVNEVSARLVAGGVLVMSLAYIATGWFPLLLVLAYGFVARVLAGPRFSPLGLLATRVITPRLRLRERFVPGPPKRFAQGIGVVFSLSALILAASLSSTVPARAVIAVLAVAASLESIAGFCLGCTVFGWLMRRGLIPAEVCLACAEGGSRNPGQVGARLLGPISDAASRAPVNHG